MTTITTVKARAKFSDLITRAAFEKDRIVLTRNGKGLAAVVPIEDVLLLEELENRADVRAAKKALKEKGSVPWERIKAELAL
jgi:prevent-host-death family protein